jgi:hypothetical protein
MRKSEIISDSGDSGSKKSKLGYHGANGGVWRYLRLTESWYLESGGRFCVDAFGWNLPSVAV